jgi:hypothetical protein
MSAPQVEGGLHQRIGGPGRRRPAPVVRGGQGGRVLTTEAVEQVAVRARGKVEGRGDGGAILAILVATPDGLAYGQGDRAWHGLFSIEGMGRGTGPHCTAIEPRGKTSCRDFAAEPHVA